MASSLSSLTDNLSQGLHKNKCKDCKSSLECMTANDGLLTFVGVDYNKIYKKRVIKIYSRDFKTPTNPAMET